MSRWCSRLSADGVHRGRSHAQLAGHSVGAASARSWLLTILGEFALPTEQPTWTSTFVTVLSGLGLEEKASRQALARTAADGLIGAERLGRRARWHLTDSGRHLLSEGAERIYSFASQTTEWDGRWLILGVAVPESQRDLRHRLKTRMNWAGFGSLATNLWVSPNTDREGEARQLLEELGLAATTMSFAGRFAGIGSERNVVEQAWNLGDIAERYHDFVAGVAADAARAGSAERCWPRFALSTNGGAFPSLIHSYPPSSSHRIGSAPVPLRSSTVGTRRGTTPLRNSGSG